MGFGTEMLFIIVLGLVVLGPQRMQGLLAQAAKYKSAWDRQRRTIETEVLKGLEHDQDQKS
jgi:Sec-independent protein translocase protein TatA